jgi:hypothetical protein
MKARVCHLMFALVALSSTAPNTKAAEGDIPPHVTVGQLLANPELYADREVVVPGYVLIGNLHMVSEAQHYLYESKEIFDRMARDAKAANAIIRKNPKPDPSWEKFADEESDLERRYCLTVVPVEPFLRNGKYLTRRTVTVRGRLTKLVGYRLFSGCNPASDFVLQVDEVLDPASAAAKPKG